MLQVYSTLSYTLKPPFVQLTKSLHLITHTVQKSFFVLICGDISSLLTGESQTNVLLVAYFLMALSLREQYLYLKGEKLR